MILRPYQSRACDSMLGHIKSSISPALIDAAPAAGKSFMIAKLAHALHKMSGKKVLCLAPSAELIKQNLEKFRMTGSPASMFSASAGAKDLRHNVVFGSPLTVKNRISKFKENYCAVICDEVHGLTPTILSIIEAMREGNPNLRVIGLTGTPYRLGSGYIFREWPDGKCNGEDTARDPYFSKCVYTVSAREMLDEGFITPMRIGDVNSSGYDTSGIKVSKGGKVDDRDIDRAFVGHGRKTSGIVADVIANSNGRFGGVMYFAATIQHAHEVLASLPPENSAIVTGTDCAMMGRKASRTQVIEAYREMRFKHLVSVGTLTTGFDVEHTSIIALLRYTESAALLLQILGRAWRLHPSKPEALLLDYAGNVDRHFPDGDIYTPTIQATGGAGGGGSITAQCPECAYENEFTAHKDYLEYKLDEAGYVLDLDGNQIMVEFGPIPGHHGRRCLGQVRTGSRGEYVRCGYRWTSKPCPSCDEPNDIAARYCCVCKAEIIDPNERLIGDFKAMKKDPTRRQCDEVISMIVKPGVSAKGNKTIRVDWITTYRSFSIWLSPDATHSRAMRDMGLFNQQTMNGERQPHTISYIKDAASGFYRVLGYNETIDIEPEGYEHKERRGDRTQGYWFDTDAALKEMGYA